MPHAFRVGASAQSVLWQLLDRHLDRHLDFYVGGLLTPGGPSDLPIVSRREGGGSVDVVAVDVRNWPWLSVHLVWYDFNQLSQVFFFIFTRNAMTIFGLPVCVVTIADWTSKPFHTPLFT